LSCGRIFDKVIRVLSISLISPAAVALVAGIVVMTAAIVARAVLGVAWLFVEEFTAYLMVLVTSFALLHTLRTQGHIKVDVITRLLPNRVREILEVCTSLLSLAVVGYLTQKATLWVLYGVKQQVHSSFVSNILLWPVYLFVAIGLLSLALGLLLEVYHSVAKFGARGKKLK